MRGVATCNHIILIWFNSSLFIEGQANETIPLNTLLNVRQKNDTRMIWFHCNDLALLSATIKDITAANFNRIKRARNANGTTDNMLHNKLTDSVAQEPEGSSPHPQQPATGSLS
jgi:hypothetical protein